MSLSYQTNISEAGSKPQYVICSINFSVRLIEFDFIAACH